MLSMVNIVTPPKMAVTKSRPKVSPFAAGYITIGMSGSQGPKIKIVNNIQGVRLTCVSVSWT